MTEQSSENNYALTDAEWFAFQRIPDQGYSHRAWVEARIRERAAQAWDDGYANGEEDERMNYERTPNPHRDVVQAPGGQSGG